MKVGLVCPYAWDIPGGVRSHVSDLAMALQDRGHEVSVLAPAMEPSRLPSWVSDGGRPLAIRYNGSVARLSFGVKATQRVRTWIRDGDFDVVHVHEPVAPSLSLLTLWAARGPLVATWHSSKDRSRILAAGYVIAQTAMEKVRGRIAVSEEARRTLVGHLGGDAILIPNGVRVQDFVGTERLATIATDRPTALFLGRMDEPRKGLDVAIHSWSDVQPADAHLYVAGPGDVAEQEALVPEALRSRVTFLGMLSDDDKARALRSVDLYLAPQTGGESFGIVLVEAMAAGTAILASDLLAFRHVLEEGRSGMLFTTRDAANLAAKATMLLRDEGMRNELISAGHDRVRSFDWNHVVADVIAVYDSVHTPGERVTEDLRGQIVGRLSRSGDSS
jgi:phosphatidylinositol alpha-mannosyltransferase